MKRKYYKQMSICILGISMTFLACEKDEIITSQPDANSATVQTSNLEQTSKAHRFEDFAPEPSELMKKLLAFKNGKEITSRTQKNEEEEVEYSLSEAVWYSEALLNYDFSHTPKLLKDYVGFNGTFTVPVSSVRADGTPIVLKSDLMIEYYSLHSLVRGRLNSENKVLAIADLWANYDATTQEATFTYEVLTASLVESGPPAPLDATDYWNACSGGKCGGYPTPSGGPQNAVERLEEIFNYTYNTTLSNLGNGGNGGPNDPVIVCAQSGVFPFYHSNSSTSYDPTIYAPGPNHLQDYTAEDLYHSYQTNPCRNATQMQNHFNFLQQLSCTFGNCSPCQSGPPCVTFQYVDIVKLTIQGGISPFSYPQANTQWRPKFFYGKFDCPSIQH